jgi:peptidoglycan/LPS O-acetylase OafA/YrhL
MAGRPAEPEKLGYLDALRGWAILLVVLSHAAQGQFAVDALVQGAPQGRVLALPDWLVRVFAYEGSCVYLFFVVSAISLTLSWRARGETNWRDYFIRRFFRVAPMFYTGVALYIALFGWGPRLYAPAGIGPGDVVLTLGFLHIWSTEALNSVVPGDWSIGAEAMFYLILPLVLTFGRTPLRLALLTAGFVLIAQIVHWGNAPFGPFGNAGFPSQAAVFLFGVCAARYAAAARFARTENLGLSPAGDAAGTRIAVACRQCAALLLFLFLFLGLPFAHLPEQIVVYHVQFAAGAALLCTLLHRLPMPILVNPPLVWLGQISFSMYVLHFALFAPIFAAAQHVAAGAGDLALLGIYYVLLVAAAAACAALAHEAIERPGMRLGRRIVARLQGRRLALESAR